MPVDLLPDLEVAPPVTGSLENIEDLMRIVAREVGRAVEGMQGSALRFENAWRRIVVEVATGQTTEIQAVRPQLLSAFAKRLRLLEETHALVTWLHQAGREDAPSPDSLVPEIDSMKQLKSTVFERWQSAEDLEELAARAYPLSTADLDAIGPQRRPPESYYAEESKPF